MTTSNSPDAHADVGISDLRGAERKRARPPAVERLANPEAVLCRSDLRELGYERRAIDAVFRACPIIALPGTAGR